MKRQLCLLIFFLVSPWVSATLEEHFRHLEADKSEEPVTEQPCVPEEGWWRPGNTYNDPSSLITDTAVECCDICRNETACLTWSRDRVTGGCALKSANSTAVENDRYDSGFLSGTDASEVVSQRRCYQEVGAVYPKGAVLRTMNTSNMEACCDECAEDFDCFSWFRNRKTYRCVLNSNVPTLKRRSKRYAGAALI